MIKGLFYSVIFVVVFSSCSNKRIIGLQNDIGGETQLTYLQMSSVLQRDLKLFSSEIYEDENEYCESLQSYDYFSLIDNDTALLNYFFFKTNDTLFIESFSADEGSSFLKLTKGDNETLLKASPRHEPRIIDINSIEFPQHEFPQKLHKGIGMCDGGTIIYSYFTLDSKNNFRYDYYWKCW